MSAIQSEGTRRHARRTAAARHVHAPVGAVVPAALREPRSSRLSSASRRRASWPTTSSGSRAWRTQDVGRYRAALDDLRRTHEPMSVEYRVTAGDGREVWVRDVGVVAREDDGELYVHGYLTRRHAGEDARARAGRGARPGRGVLPRLAGRARHHRCRGTLPPSQRRTRADERRRPLRASSGRTLAEIAPADRGGRRSAPRPRSSAPACRSTSDWSSRSIARRRAPRDARVLLPDRDGGRDAVRPHRHRHHRAAARRGGPGAAEQQYRRLIEQLPLVTYVTESSPRTGRRSSARRSRSSSATRSRSWLDDVQLWDRIVHPDDLRS